MLVLGRIHIVAELLGGERELGLGAKIGSVGFRFPLGTFLAQATDPLRTAAWRAAKLKFTLCGSLA